jgi:hypothetical protein
MNTKSTPITPTTATYLAAQTLCRTAEESAAEAARRPLELDGRLPIGPDLVEVHFQAELLLARVDPRSRPIADHWLRSEPDPKREKAPDVPGSDLAYVTEKAAEAAFWARAALQAWACNPKDVHPPESSSLRAGEWVRIVVVCDLERLAYCARAIYTI